MSEQEKKDGVELDFDWDDALADWERDVDDRSEAVSAPMPQKPAESVKEPARALYRPPSPDEFKRPVPRAPQPPRAIPEPRPIEEDVHVGFDDDDDEEEHTRIASIPKELIASLVLARDEKVKVGKASEDSAENRAVTRPPPPGEAPAGPPPVDLDLDDMLEGLDSETRAYPQELPKVVSPIRTSVPPASGPGSAGRASAPPQVPAQMRVSPVPAAPATPATATTPSTSAAPPTAASPPAPSAAFARPGGLVPPPSGVAPPRPPPAIPGMPRPPIVPPPGALPAVPRPGVPRPAMPPRPLGAPSPVVPPGAKGLPAIPRPGAPRLPMPGAAAPPALPLPGRPPGATPVPEETTAVLEEPIPARARPSVPGDATTGAPPAPPPSAPASAAESEAPRAERAPVPSDATELLDALLPSDVPQAAGAGALQVSESSAGAPDATSSAPSPPPGASEPLHAEPSLAEPSLAEPSLAEPSLAEPSLAELALDLAADDLLPEPPAAAAAPPSSPIGENDLEDDFFDRASRARSAPPPSRLIDAGLAALDAELDAATAALAPPDAAAPSPESDAEAPSPEIATEVAFDDLDRPSIETFVEPLSIDRPSVADLVASTADAADEDFDDEPRIEAAPADEDFDDEEPIVEAAAEGDFEEEDLEEPPAPVRADRGAAAARRTVRSRKPRVEVFPLVGRSAEALAARRDLLLRLAETTMGAAKARLLMAAAELEHQLGRPDGAREHVLAAREADPRDVVALRAARRAAIERGAYDEAAALLEAEAKLPVSREEKGAALLALAELQIGPLGDAPAAEKAAVEALAIAPRSVAAAMIVAEARAVQGRDGPAADALRRAGDAWGDLRARAALLVTAARDAERGGDLEGASEMYRDAREADPSAIDAVLGVARTEGRAPGSPVAASKATADALDAIARQLPEGVLRDTFTRRGALALLAAPGVDGAPGLALERLADARTLPALRARALAAAQAGDRDAEIDALESWAGASGGTDRALALVRLAEAHAAAGEPEAADETLRAASLADASLGTIRIVRELLARKSGDRGRLVSAVEHAGALSAAARLAMDPANVARERELTAEARRGEDAPLTAEVIALDLAAAAGDDDEVSASLRREVDRAPPDHRSGGLLALADRALQAGDPQGAERHLREARELAPGDPVLLRPLGRLIVGRSAAEAAAVWLEEATAATSSRAAFAATAAGALLEGAAEGEPAASSDAALGGDASAAAAPGPAAAIAAYRRALDAHAGFLPALWRLEPLARAAGDAAQLGDAHERLADGAADPVDGAAHLVRAALLRAESDPTEASALLARAREKAPTDAVLVDLSLRLGEGLSPDERATLLLTTAEGAPPALSRALSLAVASALEDAGEPARAAEIHRGLAQRHENDALIMLALDRAELAAGETARVAERRFAAVRDASDDEQRVLALERLAELDMESRQDPASAVLSLHSILEFAPGHVPSLRTLERFYMEQDRKDDLLAIEERFAQHLGSPEDVSVHLRFAARLRLSDPTALGDAADPLFLASASRAAPSAWLARRASAAAKAAGANDLAADMDLQVASRLSSALARASATMRAAESRAQLPDGAPIAAVLLGSAVDAAPDHPAAAELLAHIRTEAGDLAGAASALTIAARAARVPGHAASLWYRAGVLWQDSIGDEDKALEALTEASRIDVGHLDVFDRLRNLLELREEHAALSELAQRRLAAGGDPAVLVELHALRARLEEKVGNRKAAKDALKSVLALSPEKLDALKRLAEICLEEEDYREAAEALIRIARIRKDRDELRWVFFTLGDIYDKHIPDPKRAEAAFRRVLKLVPDDIESMERLASVLRADGQVQAATEVLSELARVEPDPDRMRQHQIDLAQALEQAGDARRAEQVLEAARRTAPTEITTLHALVEFYQRQKAQSALAIHLNRAVADFRQALQQDLTDAAAWAGLVEVLRWRGRHDSARATASAAYAAGVRDLDIARLLDASGAAPAAGAAAVDPELDDRVAPSALPAPARTVLRLAGSTLEKIVPFDPRAYRAEKVGPRDTALRPLVLEIAKWMGVPEPELWITPAAPRACVPVSSAPIAILVGKDIQTLDERERLFVLVRAMKIAREGLAVVVRTQPQELVHLMSGLVHSFDPHYQPPGVDRSQLEDWGRRVAKQMPRKLGDELGPVVFEMAGSPDYDPARMPMAVSELGDRIALLATGSVPAGVSALLALSGESAPAETPSARVAQLRRFPEALALVHFAMGDVHFDARAKVIRAAPPPPPGRE